MITRGPRVRVPVRCDADRVLACQRGLELARALAFDEVDRCALSTIILELSQNLLDHAGHGLLSLRAARGGVEVASFDSGPGIVDVDRALAEGYSTRGTLGCGLPAVRRLSHGFRIHSRRGHGTVVTALRRAGDRAH